MSTRTTWEYATIPLLTHNTKAILDSWGSTAGSWSRCCPGRAAASSWWPT
ncbi:hypothetical protein ACFQX8_18105 [Klenkia terrae]